jgi:hypothetical protein
VRFACAYLKPFAKSGTDRGAQGIKLDSEFGESEDEVERGGAPLCLEAVLQQAGDHAAHICVAVLALFFMRSPDMVLYSPGAVTYNERCRRRECGSVTGA